MSSHWKKILKEEYHKFKYRSFKTNTLASSIKYITSSKNINNNSLDMLSNKLGCNILILENRITKDNRRGFVLYKNKSNRYILIYRYKMNDSILCSPVIINNKTIILNELPNKIKNYVLGDKNQPHQKKKIKVIIKKKQT